MNHFWTNYPRAYDLIQVLATGGFMKKIANELEELQGKRVLDIGCGTGNLAKWFRFKDYTGIDPNKSYIQKAKEKFPELEFRVTDAATDPLPSRVYDYAVLINVLHHLTDKQVAKLFLNLNKAKIKKNVIVVESYPVGLIGSILKKMDEGDNFRSHSELNSLLKKHTKVETQDIVYAPLGTYRYAILQLSLENS